MLVGINKLEKEGLVPYLIGFDEGAFSKKYMTYMLGVVGVEITKEKEIIKKIEQDVALHKTQNKK